MASGQGSKSATLPPRASPPKGTNHKSSPTFNRGIFGKLKKKFRKSKGYEFDFAESKNVEGVYFKRKKDDFPPSGLENNHEQRRSGIVEVRRSQSERSPVKPFYGVDYKHGIGNHARTSKQQTFAGNGIQQPNSSLVNKNSDVENYFLTAKNGEIDLDNDCGVSRSLDKIPSIDDMDPGYETLDEVRQKMKNLPKAKTVPYQPVTEGADACNVSHDNNAIEIRPKTQIHRRTQSSGTTDHLLSTVSDFDPNRDSGLGSPLIVDSPGSRKSAMLYRESTSSNADICTSGGNTKKNYTHQRADLFSNLHTMRAGSCPLNTDDLGDVPISCVSNHSDTCLNQNITKVNFDDELYANPKVIMHKKYYRGSNSGLRKLEISEHDQLSVSDHLQTVAKENDLEIDIGEIVPPPLPERKYSISELDQSDTVVMETDNVAQQKGTEGGDRISGSLGSCEESAHSEKVSDELKQTAENSEVDLRLSENVLRDQTSERDYLPELEKSNEINCVTNQIEVSCREVMNCCPLVNHKDECHPVVTYWQQNQTNFENVEQNQNEKHCNSWTKDEEQTRLHNSSINSEDSSFDRNSSEGRCGENCGNLESSYNHKKYDPCVEVTHGSRSAERFPSIHVSFPIKPLSSSIAKCRNNSKVKSSKSSSDPDHAPSSLICETTFGSDTSSCSVISSDSHLCVEKTFEISNGCHKMKDTDRSACEADSVKIYGKNDSNMALSEESFSSEQDLEKNSDKVLQDVKDKTNLESSNQMCVSSDPPSRGSYGGLQLNLYKEKKTVPSNKECYQSQNEVIRCSEELGIKEMDIAGIASSNTDDSLDLMAENKSNIPEVSYEDNADLVLESLSETLAGDFSSMENLLDCSVESSNSLEEDGAPASEPMKTSTCEKLEVCAADMFDIDSQSNANHFKRLPDYYYEDSEPIHMSLSDLGIEENHFQRRPRHDNKHPDDSDISKNTDSNGCSSNCVTPEDSEVRIGHSNDLPDVPLPSRLKTRSLALDNSNNVSHDSSTGPVLRKSKSVIDDRPPAIIPRTNPELACRKDFMESMQQLKDCGWYWGPLSWDEAEIKLMNKPDGSFLVRDSSDERYILSLSFNTNGYVHHTRIEHHKGKFSFWSQPDSLGKSTIREFIEQCVRNSRNGQFLYFIRPSGPGAPPMPVHLLHPVSRFKQMQSLQHMCRFRILQVVRRDHIDKLPVPTRIKEYLRESQYYVECLED